MRIQVRAARRQSHGRHATVHEYGVECRTVFPVAVVNQIPMVDEEPVVRHREISRGLGHPGLVREGCQSRDVDPARRHMHDEQDVVGHEATQRPHLSGEEIRRGEYVPVGADELFPVRSNNPNVFSQGRIRVIGRAWIGQSRPWILTGVL